MRQFILYIVVLFSVLFLLYVYRDDNSSKGDQNTIKVYASGSFISDWGPGPQIKKNFELQYGIKINFIEMSDPGITLQKIGFASDEIAGDVILGLDQFDIVRFADKAKWKNISDIKLNHQNSILNFGQINQIEQIKNFIPYDWSAISFVRRSDNKVKINRLKDLLALDLKSKIALEDPRTSSPGLQFLLWVACSFNEPEAIQFLKDMNNQAHSYSPNWSTAYGLFKNKNADLVLSYVTSPMYHLIEEHDEGYQALSFEEGLPVQIEFAGVLSQCKDCEAAYKFISFIQTKEIQKIIMAKNYMLPVDKSAAEGTAFDTINRYKLIDFKVHSKEEINKWIRIWTDLKKNEN